MNEKDYNKNRATEHVYNKKQARETLLEKKIEELRADIARIYNNGNRSVKIKHEVK